MNRSISDLELLIAEKQREIADLTRKLDAPKEEVIYNAGDGKVGYYGVGAGAEVEKRIYELKVEIENYRKTINEMKGFSAQKEKQDAIRSKEQQEYERKEKQRVQEQLELEKSIAKGDFRKVKQLYKANTNFLERASLKIQGRGLRKSYTPEELQFILSTFYGQTYTQQRRHETIRNQYSDFTERKEKIHESNVREFKRMIGKDDLSAAIEYEEINKGRSR